MTDRNLPPQLHYLSNVNDPQESLTAAGGWSAPAHQLPEITVARGGLRWPSPAELLPKVRAERDTARENARFWRRAAIALAACGLAGNTVTVTAWLGWW